MRWRGGRRSDNIEDRRGQGRPRRLGRRRGLPIRLPSGRGGKLGIVGILAIVGISLFLGIDPTILLQGGSQQGGMQSSTQSGPIRTTVDDELTQFVSVVLADTEDTWQVLFENANKHYREPTLVLFSGSVQSACGYAQSAMGPFYCPGDQKVYLDLTFFEELRSRFDAPGDFAQAYVIAHEVGHHVQTLLGISQKVNEQRSHLSDVEGNKLSVRLELQADCLAGVWAYNADRSRNILEAGDIEEALNAATAIGDDRLQKRATGMVVPDSFTHGSSKQRVRWFMVGFENGNVSKCDTFGTDDL
ncbi:KPN_02809 family neutral zinc metallopeptidase [Sneathiella litorea]|uniref:Flagellar biosynthesis protein FlgM n=1 Tax=Sneathiella litorea TaxID=2606216 RepID=A0A6L8WAC7_9PROT|nr:neutral zinc metallopeptidase [Sneathiella litorea]MZR31669.1 flagellar biosynthesis protein FlgM [Sneathiella litorea]